MQLLKEFSFLPREAGGHGAQLAQVPGTEQAILLSSQHVPSGGHAVSGMSMLTHRMSPP